MYPKAIMGANAGVPAKLILLACVIGTAQSLETNANKHILSVQANLEACTRSDTETVTKKCTCGSETCETKQFCYTDGTKCEDNAKSPNCAKSDTETVTKKCTCGSETCETKQFCYTDGTKCEENAKTNANTKEAKGSCKAKTDQDCNKINDEKDCTNGCTWDKKSCKAKTGEKKEEECSKLQTPQKCKENGCTWDNTKTSSCFPGNALVMTPFGERAMKSLSVGDEVASATGFEKITGFIHADNAAETDFVELQHTAGRVRASANHLLFKADGSDVPAGDLVAGDKLLQGNGSVEILSVKTVTLRGFFAPHTPSGTIIVDGVIASDFATPQGTHWAAKLMIAPVSASRVAPAPSPVLMPISA